jgi:two-component system, cell cycle sensor histidine kinase and response regulator CckA
MLKQKKRFVDESKDLNEIHLLYEEQVKQLYKHTLIGVAATLLNSLILTYILWNVIPHVALTIWFAACLSVSFFRYLISRRFWRSSQTPTEYSRQEMWFNIGIAFSGIVWGSAGIFLFPIDSVAHQIFIAFVLGGMVAGAAGTFSIILRPFIVFSLPTLVPIIIRFFVIADHIHVAMGGMTLLFGLLMFTTAKRINTATVSSLQLQFENRGLIHQLEHRVKERTADLVETNEKLKRANEAMRESEEQLLSLLQNIQAAVVVHGPDTKILKCNKASQELLGLTEGQMLGKKADDPLWIFLNEDGSDMPLESYPVNQAIATQNVLKNVIVGVYRSNKNDVVRIIVNAVPEIDHDGNISQVI